jgi:hypothetical protein
MKRLAREPFRVKFALLPEGTQPDTVEEAVLRELLNLRSWPPLCPTLPRRASLCL